jgi:hypothetical protein
MKRKAATTLLFTALLGAGIAVRAGEGKAAAKPQTTCPVMGGKINKEHYVDVKGYRIYVCCPGCLGKIKADPDTYIKKLQDEGITLEKKPKKEEAKAEDHQHDHSDHQH